MPQCWPRLRCIHLPQQTQSRNSITDMPRGSSSRWVYTLTSWRSVLTHHRLPYSFKQCQLLDMSWLFVFCFNKVIPASFQLMIPLPQPPQYWDYRYAPPYSALYKLFKIFHYETELLWIPNMHTFHLLFIISIKIRISKRNTCGP